MPSLPNMSLSSMPLWSRMRALVPDVRALQPRLSTPRGWRLSSVGKRPRPSTVQDQRRSSIVRRFSVVNVLASPVTTSLEGSTELQDYELLGVLGRGSFGVVRLARHRATGRAVAIKMLDKSEVTAMKQEVNILREQSVHLKLQHPFISRIYTTFQDNTTVYFVLEYCPGGELYSLVYQEEEEMPEPAVDMMDQHIGVIHEDDETCATESESSDDDNAAAAPGPAPAVPADVDRRSSASSTQRKRSHSFDNNSRKRALAHPAFGGLREPHVAFYVACVVSALSYLHDVQNVLYRDLKLENLVIAEDGYPKLIDFGLSKPEAARTNDRSSTMCGSAEYLAPEVVQRQPYDHRVDLWSLGVLLYELFFGATPFYHPNSREQSRRICEAPVEFPAAFETECPLACELMRSLLSKNPQERPASCHVLKQHAFFKQFFPTDKSWQQLEAKQTRSPFVPTLMDPFDTSPFANAYEDEEEDDTYQGY